MSGDGIDGRLVVRHVAIDNRRDLVGAHVTPLRVPRIVGHREPRLTDAVLKYVGDLREEGIPLDDPWIAPGIELGARLLIASDDPHVRARGTWALALPPSLPEWLMPIVSIVPAQLHARHLTIAKGGDPEQPRSIRKVTLTH